MIKSRVKLLNNKYIVCTMWNKMKLAAQIRIVGWGGGERGGRDREREISHAPMSWSLVANPKSGPDYSVFIMK
jgi:hypothetical protein